MKLKTIILTLLLIFNINKLNAQCGVWKAKPIYYTEWKTIDTTNKTTIITNKRRWGYIKPEITPNLNEIGAFYPCTFNYPTIWVEYRLCKVTGILEQRFKIKEWVYIPNENDLYFFSLNSVDDK